MHKKSEDITLQKIEIDIDASMGGSHVFVNNQEVFVSDVLIRIGVDKIPEVVLTFPVLDGNIKIKKAKVIKEKQEV